MVAGQSVCVLYNPLLTDVYEDGLTTHSTDIVREVLGWHARCVVILKEQREKTGTLTPEGHSNLRLWMFSD